MSVMYSVFPLRGEMREWLQSQRAHLPGQDGRNPRPSRLLQALRSLEGFDVEESGFTVGAPWTALVQHKEDPERGGWLCASIIRVEEGEKEFYFEWGSPEVVIEVLVRLSLTLGPLVMMTDAGDEPVAVRPGDSAQGLFASWGA